MRRILTTCILVVSLLLGPAFAARANLDVFELPLTAGGRSFEVRADTQGRVWVSDYGNATLGITGELWRVNPVDGTYRVYAVGGQPSDATPDFAGNAWWVSSGSLYRMNADTGAYTAWNISSNLWSVEVDYQGKVWVNDDYTGTLYRFDPQNDSQLCSYPLGTTDQGYMLITGALAWVGDTSRSKIYRLDASQDPPRLTSWSLPPSHHPYDLAADGSGSIWYTNDATKFGFGGLGRLDAYAAQHQVTEYTLPSGEGSKMLTTVRGKVWYTEQDGPFGQGGQLTFGRLDPAQAVGTPFVAEASSPEISASCTQISPSVEDRSFPMREGNTAWDMDSYPNTVATGGWLVYQLPSGAIPVGIAMTSEGWLVDFNRNKLVHFNAGIPSLGHLKTYLPAIQR